MKSLSLIYHHLLRQHSSTSFSSLWRFYSKECRFNVSSFGRLSSTKPSGSFKICPLNPHEYMEQDLVVLRSDDCDIAPCAQQNESLINLSGHQGTCNAEIPMKFDLQLETTGTESIHVEGLENELIDLSTQQGSCTLMKLMTRCVNVETISGDVTSESSVQADVNIKTKSGNVKLYKILGQSLNIEAEQSLVSVNALYSFTSNISVTSGDIGINHCHHDNQLSIREEGNVHVGTLDGSIVAKVDKGNVDIQMNNPTTVEISVASGDITLSIPDNLAVNVSLNATSIHVDDSIKDHSALEFSNDGKSLSGVVRGGAEPPSPRITPLIQAELPEVKARTASGTIKLRKRDWLSSMMEKMK